MNPNLWIAALVISLAGMSCGEGIASELLGGSGGGAVAGSAGGTAGSTGTGGGSSTGSGGVVSHCLGGPGGNVLQGPAQLASLCSRGYADPVTRAFCASPTPTVTSVTDVLRIIGLGFTGTQGSGLMGNPSFVLATHSTSLSMRLVSQLNPRAIVFTVPLSERRVFTPKPNASYVAMGFTRGEQAIELAAKDPTLNGGQGGLRLFLLKYTQPCNGSAQGCTPGDLYTPSTESGFTGWSLYDDEDLKNTVVDCRQCHQPAGPGTTKMLRLQELQAPWPHWMYDDVIAEPSRVDFAAAHGTNEAYGGVPGPTIFNGSAPQLEGLVENNGFQTQPNEFLGNKILNELKLTPGSSATWSALYQASAAGQFIAVPYYAVDPTDRSKLAALTQSYRAVMAGTLPKHQLPDLADVFTVDAQRHMRHRPAAGLTGRQILTQMCQGCHNSHLDQAVSRSRFNVERLDTLPRYEKDEAIRRINLPPTACDHMPPLRFSELDAAEMAAVEAELRR